MLSSRFLLATIAVLLLAMPAPASAAIDLTVPTLGNPPTQLVTRGTMRPAAAVRNAGSTAALASRTGFYLSRDRIVGNDVLVSSVPTIAIRGMRNASLRPTLRLPSSVMPGRWYLVACADQRRTAREGNERNNCRVSLGAVRVFAPTFSITSPVAGQTTGATTTLQYASNVALTVTCALDGAAFASCSAGTAFTLASGSHTLAVRGTDAAGNVLNRSVAWIVDASAPTIGFTDLSEDLTNDRSETFAFSSNESATFECRVDDATFTACTSPFVASGLADGAHTLRVRATDPYGNVSAVSTHTWTVDATAPETTITSGPSAGSFVSSTTATFEFTSTGGASYQCTLDGAVTACVSPRQLTGLAEAAHTFTVAATDAAGNTDPTPASRTWTVDRTGPSSLEIVVPPYPEADSVTIGFTASEIVTLQCRLIEPVGQAHDWQACGTPQPNPLFVDVTYSGLPDGDYSLEVAAVDRAGNPGPSVLNPQWTIDTTPPQLGFTGGPIENAVSGPSTMFSFAVSGASSVECSLDSGSWTPCTSPHPLNSLSHGVHVLQVRGTDAAGNETTIQRTWAVDAQAPQTTITSGPNGLIVDNTPTWTFSSNEQGSSFTCRIDGGSWAPCTSPFTTSALADGSHTFEVRATDPYGNTDPTPDTRSITVDTTPPDTTITNQPASPTNATSPSFSFTGNGASSFQCSLDGGGYSTCTSPHTYSSLSNGSHSFSVRALDAAGNIDPSPAVYNWTIDTAPPQTTITSGPPSLTNSRSATFTFTSTESGLFQCSLDAAGFSGCASGQTYTSLGDGPHTFRVQAMDQAGNVDTSPATYSWTVDGTPPDTTITSTVHDWDFDTVDVYFTASEIATFQCTQTPGGGSGWTSCTSPHTANGFPNNVTDWIYVRAIDQFGNVDPTPASYSWNET